MVFIFMKSIKKHWRNILKFGLKLAFLKFISSKLVKLGLVEDAEKLRQRLSAEINQRFDSTIAYGSFKGFKFTKNSWWSKHDRGSMILGLYEKEIIEILLNTSKERSVFIDIGAADGYYAVASVKNYFFDRSYCFEIEQKGRSVIRQNSILNGVAEKVIIFGEANRKSLLKIPKADISNSVVLIDIEGFEFDFLDTNILNILKESVCIIELHDWYFEDGKKRLEELRKRASKKFQVSEFKLCSRDTSNIKELDLYSDNERWIICSEGRPRSMTWLRLDPKALQNELIS